MHVTIYNSTINLLFSFFMNTKERKNLHRQWNPKRLSEKFELETLNIIYMCDSWLQNHSYGSMFPFPIIFNPFYTFIICEHVMQHSYPCQPLLKIFSYFIMIGNHFYPLWLWKWKMFLPFGTMSMVKFIVKLLNLCRWP